MSARVDFSSAELPRRTSQVHEQTNSASWGTGQSPPPPPYWQWPQPLPEMQNTWLLIPNNLSQLYVPDFVS